MRQKKPTKRSGSGKPKPKIIEFKSHQDMPLCAVSLSDSRYNKTGGWRSIKPIVNEKMCISCAICWKFCPEPCIEMVDGVPVIDYDYCKGCGICIEVCPKKAIFFAEEDR